MAKTKPKQLKTLGNTKVQLDVGNPPPVMLRRINTRKQFVDMPKRSLLTEVGKQGTIPKLISGKSLALLFLLFIALPYLFYKYQQQPKTTFELKVSTPLFLENISAGDNIQAPDRNLPLPLVDSTLAANLTHRVKRGDTLGAIGNKYGLDSADVTAIHNLSADKKNSDTDLLHPGYLLTFKLNEFGRVTLVKSQAANGKSITIQRDSTGNFVHSQPQAVEVNNNDRVAVGVIKTSFAAAASRTGVDYEIIDDLVDLFSDRVEFKKDFQVGDRFTLIYRNQVSGRNQKSKNSGAILAAALEIDGEHLIAARYIGNDGKARYFDEKGKMLGSNNSFLRYPLKFSRISSYFNKSRFHPVLKIARPHNGIDFAAPIGTPVRTVADGEVLFAGMQGGNGNMVKIQHGTRYTTAYCHLSKISKGLKKGVKVSRGEVIGAVGMTGLATGPHLHFGFFDNDKYVDPLRIKLPILDSLNPGTMMNPNYLRRVLFTLNHYQTIDLGHFYTRPEGT